MAKDITKDSEYIRGYEEAKRQIEEERNSPYRQGRKAAFREDSQRRYSETEQQCEKEAPTTTSEVTVSMESPSFRKELIDILREFIAIEQKNSAEIKSLDERLQNLEKYTQD